MKVASTYGMNRTSSEFAPMDCSEGVFRLRTQPRSSRDSTHHRMEDIMGHSALILRFGKVDSSGQPCMKTRRTSSEDVERVRGMV